jgi:hypothetical protein
LFSPGDIAIGAGGMGPCGCGCGDSKPDVFTRFLLLSATVKSPKSVCANTRELKMPIPLVIINIDITIIMVVIVISLICIVNPHYSYRMHDLQQVYHYLGSSEQFVH